MILKTFFFENVFKMFSKRYLNIFKKFSKLFLKTLFSRLELYGDCAKTKLAIAAKIAKVFSQEKKKRY